MKSTTVENLLATMTTGLNDEDEVSWQEYCKSEASAFQQMTDGTTKGIKVSGKAEKGRVKFKGGEVDVKNVRINRALLALDAATRITELMESTGFSGLKVDASELCQAWKERRDSKRAHLAKESVAASVASND